MFLLEFFFFFFTGANEPEMHSACERVTGEDGGISGFGQGSATANEPLKNVQLL